MKIVHLCLACFFPDNYSYQENLLPKFHKEFGYKVEVLASLMTFDENGKPTHIKKGCSYINENDINVVRLDYKRPIKLYRKLKRYTGTYEALEKMNPDVLFIHGCQFMDMDIVIKYLKSHSDVCVFVDSHADFSNSATNIVSKIFLHKIFWRHTAKMIEPFATKFYGVLPARVDFLKNVYKLPPEKCELLVMGADDDLVEKSAEPHVRKSIRAEHNISEEDFLIVTGGKIDLFKKQTLLLMEAVKQMKNPKVKLLVFGSVVPELKEEVVTLCDGNRIQYIGWIQSKESYDYFAAADLVVFPGRHSVFWEQVAAQGIPMICKYWDGTTHVDLGGNVKFLYKDSAEEIKYQIEYLVENQQEYEHMKQIAVERGMKEFSYRDIAKRAIEV